jgi:hypothetical protein
MISKFQDNYVDLGKRVTLRWYQVYSWSFEKVADRLGIEWSFGPFALQWHKFASSTS